MDTLAAEVNNYMEFLNDVQTLTTLQSTLGEAVKTLDTLANSETGELTQKIGTVMEDVATLQTQINNDKNVIDSHNEEITNKVKRY